MQPTYDQTDPTSPAGSIPHWIDPVRETDLVARRRTVHRTPETGWAEFIATARAAEFFTSLGFKVMVGREFIDPIYVRGRSEAEVSESERLAKAAGVSPVLLQRMGGLTGLCATFDTGHPGKTLAFRVELDALKMNEPVDPDHIPSREGFASERPGEEGSRGAYPIVQSGLLDDVDTLLCAHIATDLQAGTVVAAPEKFLCTTKIDLHFEGVQAHAGMQPQLGRNALLAAADAALILMALPRHSDGMTRVNVGTLHAGEGRNVIAAHADMEVEVRGENEAINRELAREAVTRAQGCAMAFGVKMSHKIMGEAVDFVPDDGIVQMITVCARRARYVREVRPSVPLNGSDDATLMIRRVQSQGGRAGYFLVGAGLEASHEHAAVDFDERYLVTLYDIFANLVIGLSGNW